MRAHTALLASVLVASPTFGQSSLRQDLGIEARVEPDRRLAPGELAKVILRYRNRGPDAGISTIAASNFFESYHARESIRWVLTDDADECPYFLDYPGFPNPEDIHYYGQMILRFGPLPAHADMECSATFRVGADPEPFPPLTFVIMDGQRPLNDPVPGDNQSSVQLLFYDANQRVMAIPANTQAGIALLAASLVAAVAWSRRLRAAGARRARMGAPHLELCPCPTRRPATPASRSWWIATTRSPLCWSTRCR